MIPVSEKWCIGIDLGTTNCALSIRRPDSDRTESLEIPQFLDESQVVSSPLLPSFGLQPEEHLRALLTETSPLPYQGGLVVGEWAKKRADQQPGRVVVSAKSWLSNSLVDRSGNILPWKADDGVACCSPLIASAMYLTHLRKAFEQRYPDAGDIAGHNVVLTVPASFDSVAKELTLKAASIAKLGVPTLLEEPQAALYSWLEKKGDDWRNELSEGDVVLVCDVGGGTTDFSLISIRQDEGDLSLERFAVGEHILLGGDNMDLALAFVLRQTLQREHGKAIDRWQFQSLVQSCRRSKERLLSDPALDSVSISIPSRGSKLIATSITVSLDRATLENVVLNGFMPKCELTTPLTGQSRTALSEAGLPYASDPAITRQLAAFLRQHCTTEEQRPSVVLFNGGVFKADALQQHVFDALSKWFSETGTLRKLEPLSLETSVASGAAYFGAVDAGDGIRIKGGLAHSYYVGIESSMPAIPGFDAPINAVCLLPFGTEEGTTLRLEGHRFALHVGLASEFRLFYASSRQDDALGTQFEIWGDHRLIELPVVKPEWDGGDEEEIVEVELEVHLSNVGTLSLACVSPENPAKRWALEFDVRNVESGRHD